MSHISETIARLNRELPPETKLVAVSKFHPVESIIEAYSAGQRAFAESRPQELAAKVERIRSLMPDSGSVPSLDGGSGLAGLPYGDIEWHFIGHLQTNKLKMVLPYVSMVQSVDSLHLLEAIDRWATDNGKVIDVLLEYHVAAEHTKQGFTRDGILSVLSGDRDFTGIRFRGLMGMATFTYDEAVIRSDFSMIKELFDEISEAAGYCPEEDTEIEGAGKHTRLCAFDQLSIGMTGDYNIAIEYGSTMVRIGTMIFGERQY